MPVTHEFVSAKSDGGDDTLVRPSDWNADHAITTVGWKVGQSGAQVVATSTFKGLVAADADVLDSDGFHFISDAALTGTVSKSVGSPNISGSGTAFTTELSVGQVITIPGTQVQPFVIKEITSDTALVAWQDADHSASGQTATRRSNYVAIPAGLGGLYDLGARWRVASNGTGYRRGGFRFNPAIHDNANAVILNVSQAPTNGETTDMNPVEGLTQLSEGDYLDCWLEQTSGANRDISQFVFWGRKVD